jgi:hypothetical protein
MFSPSGITPSTMKFWGGNSIIINSEPVIPFIVVGLSYSLLSRYQSTVTNDKRNDIETKLVASDRQIFSGVESVVKSGHIKRASERSDCVLVGRAH